MCLMDVWVCGFLGKVILFVCLGDDAGWIGLYWIGLYWDRMECRRVSVAMFAR